MNLLHLSPAAVSRNLTTSALSGDGLDLAMLDLEAYWTADEGYAALGYDEAPRAVPAYAKVEG